MGPDLRLVIILVRYKVCWTGAQRKQARPFVAGFVVRRSAGGELVSANFYEKALFVKPTWRHLVAECNSCAPFALCFYPHFR